jgi:DNA mismatch endonuclease (patch repair protein)
MTDVVTPEQRSRMMAGIQGKDTQPEILIRKGLHALGFRFRLHGKHLPGKPDLVLAQYKAVIFINGCFWHSHDCHLFKWPSTRPAFWKTKISQNAQRDLANYQRLHEQGWRVLVIWECALKGRTRLLADDLLLGAADWLRSDHQHGEITGVKDAAA